MSLLCLSCNVYFILYILSNISYVCTVIKVLAANTICIVFFFFFFALHVIYLLWMLPEIIFLNFQQEPHLALQKYYDHLVHFIFIPAMNAFIQVPQQYRNFWDIRCYIIGWYPRSLLKNLKPFEKALHFKATICVHTSCVVNVLLLWLHLQKLSKFSFYWNLYLIIFYGRV